MPSGSITAALTETSPSFGCSSGPNPSVGFDAEEPVTSSPRWTERPPGARVPLAASVAQTSPLIAAMTLCPSRDTLPAWVRTVSRAFTPAAGPEVSKLIPGAAGSTSMSSTTCGPAVVVHDPCRRPTPPATGWVRVGAKATVVVAGAAGPTGRTATREARTGLDGPADARIARASRTVTPRGERPDLANAGASSPVVRSDGKDTWAISRGADRPRQKGVGMCFKGRSGST